MPSDFPSAEDPPAGLDPSRLDIETRQLPLDELLARFRDGELEIGPPSEDGRPWSATANSRLIESLLVRIPMPALYVDAADEDRWIVIDGRRRLAALSGFVLDKAYALAGLEYLTELEGQGYDDLARAQKRRLGETPVALEIVKPGASTAIRCNIFRRVNPCRPPHEVREAVLPGPGRDLIAALAGGDAYRAATGAGDAGVADREAVLRFLAFFPMAHPPAPARSFEDVLTETLEGLNEVSLDGKLRRHLLSRHFETAMTAATTLFDGRAFRPDDGEKPISRALLETWSVVLARLDRAETDALLARRVEVIKAFTELLHDQDFAAAIASGIDDPDSVKTRFAAVHDLVGQFVSA